MLIYCIMKFPAFANCALILAGNPTCR